MRILAVEDEKLALDGLCETLRRVLPKSEVHACTTMEEALAAGRQNAFQIAFLDIELGMGSGIALAEKLKEMQERLNIIFVTGYEEYKADAMDLHASGYITKPVTERKLRAELKELRFPPQEEKGSRIRVQTFGNFEVFLDGHPAEFKYKKTKEMFAFMIDRHGASCTNGMLIDILWENEVDAGRKSSYLRNLRQDMVSAFSVHGLAEVIRMQRGAVAVNVDLVKCDYYEWLSGNRSGENEYRGEYMTQYSWAEETNAMLNFS